MNIVPENSVIIPLVPLRGLVVFPGMIIHFDVGRKKSIAAIRNAMDTDRPVFLVSQRDVADENPEKKDVYEIGVTAKVCQILKLSNKPDGPVRVSVEGIQRCKLLGLIKGQDCLRGQIEVLEEKSPRNATKEYKQALVRQAKDFFDAYSDCAPQLPKDMSMSVMREDDPGKLADYIAGNIMLDYPERQEILETVNPVKRLEKVCVLLSREARLLMIEADIHDKVQEQIDENQREFYLREQMRAISEELSGSAVEENDSFREAISNLNASEEVKTKLLKSCARLEKCSPTSPEAAVERNYIETCLELPWGVYSKDNLNLKRARKVLDDDHYGLEKVKERIIELLAVRNLAPDITGQIVCLVGPPGVGKTSVARSIARAMGREYVRISLGGVKDEAEIRGHRKTYIGSMPGRIIDALKKAKTANPLILLDEIDKLSSDYKGDPTSALLEVLDPEQNSTFRDHYLELPFDLSKVLFITTANLRQNIPEPLLDRMEIIELGSYTHEEKFHIAKKHLIRKQVTRHGLTASNIRITDSALHALIDEYTSEAGVRKLEQQIAALCRKVSVRIAEGEGRVTVKETDLATLLGSAKYKKDKKRTLNETGVVNGLAWTRVGGEMLEVEACVLDGTGKIELTGSLGDVMKESAMAAVSFIRSLSDSLAIDPEFYKNKDIHLHFPEGATPKDGPSAGIAISTALVSALTDTAVRADVAMTGEISLRGRVLAIGGLKEKTMAAYRAGIKKVIIPEENLADLDEVDSAVKANVEFVPVTRAQDVWVEALANDGYLKQPDSAKGKEALHRQKNVSNQPERTRLSQ